MRPLPRILAITDNRAVAADDFPVRAAAIAAAGSAIGILVRAPSVAPDHRLGLLRRVRALAGPPEAAVIADHDPASGRAAGAHGVQLGAEAPSVGAARAIFGAGWIGVTIRDRAAAQRALDEGADWVLLEHPFPAEGTADQLGDIAAIGIPVFAPGDVPLEQLESVRATGAWGIAVTSLWDASDSAKATDALLRAWTGSP